MNIMIRVQNIGELKLLDICLTTTMKIMSYI